MATVAQTQEASSVFLGANRILGLLGIIGVITFFVGGFGFSGDFPTIDDPVAEARTWWADNGDTYLVGDYITGIAFAIFITPFIAGMNSMMSKAEGELPVGSRANLMAFLLFLAMVIAGTIGNGVLALGIEDIESDGTIRMLQYMDFYVFSGGVPVALALFFFSAAYVIHTTHVLWKGLAWVAVPLGVVGVIASACPIDGSTESIFSGLGLLTIAGFFLWLLAASINLFTMKASANEV